MLRITAGLAVFLVAVVTVGCGTANPGSTTNATARSSSSCQSPAPASRSLVVTAAGNAKTYCLRVGSRLRVELGGADSSPWLPLVVSGTALGTVQSAVTANGLTSASFAAVQPGRAILTSVRSPCQIVVPSKKQELEPAFPLPTVSPPSSCAPGHRFSALVIVLR
ncbi:MAG: hypothetical protein JO345_16265 [Streptosporangiaceae bacterium]|nr:hypothetical protein [Streptosporangiaceae bacterium]